MDSNNNATVYITNQNPEHPYDTAAEYGTVRFLTSGKYPFFKTVKLQDEIIKGLVDSHEDDYLLISGSAMIAALCLSVWLLKHTKCKVLLYDPSAGGKYAMRVVSRKDIQLAVERTHDAEERKRTGVK